MTYDLYGAVRSKLDVWTEADRACVWTAIELVAEPPVFAELEARRERDQRPHDLALGVLVEAQKRVTAIDALEEHTRQRRRLEVPAAGDRIHGVFNRSAMRSTMVPSAMSFATSIAGRSKHVIVLCCVGLTAVCSAKSSTLRNVRRWLHCLANAYSSIRPSENSAAS